jgi:hypothetical protein
VFSPSTSTDAGTEKLPTIGSLPLPPAYITLRSDSAAATTFSSARPATCVPFTNTWAPSS